MNNEVKTIFYNDLKTNLEIFKISFGYVPLKDKINKLYDLVLYSDPVSVDEVVELEDKILKKLEVLKENYLLEKFVKMDLVIDELEFLIKERNVLCKQFK